MRPRTRSSVRTESLVLLALPKRKSSLKKSTKRIRLTSSQASLQDDDENKDDAKDDMPLAKRARTSGPVQTEAAPIPIASVSTDPVVPVVALSEVDVVADIQTLEDDNEMYTETRQGKAEEIKKRYNISTIHCNHCLGTIDAIDLEVVTSDVSGGTQCYHKGKCAALGIRDIPLPSLDVNMVTALQSRRQVDPVLSTEHKNDKDEKETKDVKDTQDVKDGKEEKDKTYILDTSEMTERDVTEVRSIMAAGSHITRSIDDSVHVATTTEVWIGLQQERRRFMQYEEEEKKIMLEREVEAEEHYIEQVSDLKKNDAYAQKVQGFLRGLGKCDVADDSPFNWHGLGKDLQQMVLDTRSYRQLIKFLTTGTELYDAILFNLSKRKVLNVQNQVFPHNVGKAELPKDFRPYLTPEETTTLVRLHSGVVRLIVMGIQFNQLYAAAELRRCNAWSNLTSLTMTNLERPLALAISKHCNRLERVHFGYSLLQERELQLILERPSLTHVTLTYSQEEQRAVNSLYLTVVPVMSLLTRLTLRPRLTHLCLAVIDAFFGSRGAESDDDDDHVDDDANAQNDGASDIDTREAKSDETTSTSVNKSKQPKALIRVLADKYPTLKTLDVASVIKGIGVDSRDLVYLCKTCPKLRHLKLASQRYENEAVSMLENAGVNPFLTGQFVETIHEFIPRDLPMLKQLVTCHVTSVGFTKRTCLSNIPKSFGEFHLDGTHITTPEQVHAAGMALSRLNVLSLANFKDWPETVWEALVSHLSPSRTRIVLNDMRLRRDFNNMVPIWPSLPNCVLIYLQTQVEPKRRKFKIPNLLDLYKQKHVSEAEKVKKASSFMPGITILDSRGHVGSGASSNHAAPRHVIQPKIHILGPIKEKASSVASTMRMLKREYNPFQ